MTSAANRAGNLRTGRTDTCYQIHGSFLKIFLRGHNCPFRHISSEELLIIKLKTTPAQPKIISEGLGWKRKWKNITIVVFSFIHNELTILVVISSVLSLYIEKTKILYLNNIWGKFSKYTSKIQYEYTSIVSNQSSSRALKFWRNINVIIVSWE